MITTTVTTSSPFLPNDPVRHDLSVVNPTTTTARPNGIVDFRIFNPFRTTHNTTAIQINTSNLLTQAAVRFEKYSEQFRSGPITVTTTTPAPFVNNSYFFTGTNPSSKVQVSTTQPPM